MSGHQCEEWQIRENPEGDRYCAACGKNSINVEFRREELARKFTGYLLKVSYANIAPSTQAAIDYIIEKEQNA